jgi:hypothetical protein
VEEKRGKLAVRKDGKRKGEKEDGKMLDEHWNGQRKVFFGRCENCGETTSRRVKEERDYCNSCLEGMLAIEVETLKAGGDVEQTIVLGDYVRRWRLSHLPPNQR